MRSVFALLFLALGAWTSPLSADKSGKKSFIAKIRRSSGQPPPNPGDTDRVFDPTYAADELKAVLAKYSQAAQFLSGIGLNPDTHPEKGYQPFTRPFIGLLNSTANNATTYNATAAHNSSKLPVSAEQQPWVGWAASEKTSAGLVTVPGTAQLGLTDDAEGGLDILYYGPLGFGSQQQELTVDIDTGSADLWVPVDCQECAGNSFQREHSSSYRNLGQKFSVTYGTGHVSGTIAQDIVTVGGLSVAQQAFGAVRSQSADFYDQPSDGLLGLAFGSIARSKQPTFFENLMLSKQLAAGAFSVHLEREQTSGSEVCFGCFDTTKAIGPIIWNSVISRTYWSILLDGLSSDASHSVPANLTAAIDTGTTLIYLPDKVAKSFYALIPGSQPAMQYGAGFYTFPCSAPLAVGLSFNGQPYRMDMVDFNLGRTAEDSPDCVGGILSLGKGFPANLAIIGDEFLKSWYSIYDYPGSRVGFAPSINNR
ncbi:acid protease [Laetiporus sulphureus 93-53]|uniref:Acid protease n=1 Tax=Laetiporus sulphureus 93-53 TaxID=1314785 RepID=A0A165GS74_9APHY|nr:acid protease [Laetiporus sulphureus 93-53]KZT10735.1 acid protease [Laetiporus sulphureus 93-53]